MKLEVSTFRSDCSDKEQALKVLEEAAEVFGAWQVLVGAQEDYSYLGRYDGDYSGEGYYLDEISAAKRCLSDEIADVITTACNLAERCGLDIDSALERCEKRNRERGRYV